MNKTKKTCNFIMLALQKNTSPSNCHSQQLIETEVTLSAAAILSL